MSLRPSPQRKVRLVLVGPSGSGKTSLQRAFMGLPFDDSSDATIGLCSVTIEVVVPTSCGNQKNQGSGNQNQSGRSESHLVDVWDTAGQERFAPLVSVYWRGADIVLVAMERSRDHQVAVERLLQRLRDECGPAVIIGLWQTKSDLPSSSVWDEEFAARMQARFDVHHVAHVSAKQHPAVTRTHHLADLLGVYQSARCAEPLSSVSVVGPGHVNCDAPTFTKRRFYCC